MMKILVIGLAVLFLVGCVAPQEQSPASEQSYQMNSAPPFTPSSPVGSADRYAAGYAVARISPPELGAVPPPGVLR